MGPAQHKRNITKIDGVSVSGTPLARHRHLGGSNR